LTKLINLVILASIVLFLVSFLKRNEFPESIDTVVELNNEPTQSVIQKPAFQTDYSGIEYIIEPQYEYELYGLVVSYRHHDGDSMLHKLWNDHLNMADVCVVWGKTALSAYLNQFDFWNRQFTCNFKTSSNLAWDSFNQNEISNNHLISSDEGIRKKIQKLAIGDQIRVAGYLSSYGAEGGGMRGTSTVRTDTGNGACETIFVKEFDILKRTKNAWRTMMSISVLSLVLSLLIYFVAPFRAYN
jgi:hypothetical protein